MLLGEKMRGENNICHNKTEEMIRIINRLKNLCSTGFTTLQFGKDHPKSVPFIISMTI